MPASASADEVDKAETEFRATLSKNLKREIHFDRFSLEIFEDQTPLSPG